MKSFPTSSLDYKKQKTLQASGFIIWSPSLLLSPVATHSLLPNAYASKQTRDMFPVRLDPQFYMLFKEASHVNGLNNI